MILADKTAIITGGSQGIGKSIAKLYLQEGCRVIIIARKVDELKKTIVDLKNETGMDEIYYYSCDISNPIEVDITANKIKAEFEVVDILVNNAGILGHKKSILDYSREIWRKVIDINVNGIFYVTQSFLPLMLYQQGTIINLSSGVGLGGRKEWGAYSVSKFGTEGFTQILAQELEEYRINVFSVNPGGTLTAMRREAYPNEDPLTLPHPDEVAELFLYLVNYPDEKNGDAISYRSWYEKKIEEESTEEES